MRKYRIALETILLVLLAVSVSGCDFFRSLAGRPTSADIAAKKILIEAENSVRQAREDSIALAKLRADEALAFADSIKNCGVSVVPAAMFSGRLASELKYRYYIMAGTFSDPDNAENFRQRLENAGYEAATLPYRNGRTAVAVSPSDDAVTVFKVLKKVRDEQFCPPDVWVLVNE